MHVLNVYICINTPRGGQPTVVYSLEELLFSRFFKNNKLLNLDFINSIPTCLLRRCVCVCGVVHAVHSSRVWHVFFLLTISHGTAIQLSNSVG